MASTASFLLYHSGWPGRDAKQLVLSLRRHGVRRRNGHRPRLAFTSKIRACHVGGTAQAVL